MKLLYGTTNEGKLAAMRRCLASLPQIELIGLNQIKAPLPHIAETGRTLPENARLKALSYYGALHMPVFSCDTGLYFDRLPGELQPGIHVRNIRGRCLTDEEMTEYYAGLARKYGDLVARYRNAICLVLDEEHIYESMDESLSGEAFLLTSVPHLKRQKGFPLDCLSKHIATGAYYYDMPDMQQDDVALNDGFLRFFQNALK